MTNSISCARIPLSSVLFILAVSATGCTGAPIDEASDEWTKVAVRIEAQMAAPDRHQYDLPRDPHRKPIEMDRILGVRDGMTIGDFGSGAGYYKRAMNDRLRNHRLPNADFIIGEEA